MPISLNETQLYEEFASLSSFELCYLGQELVQELVSKVSETIQILRHVSLYLLHSDQASYVSRKNKLDELLATFELLIKKLRIAASLANQRRAQSAQHQLSSSSSSTTSVDTSRLRQERDQLVATVKERSKEIKATIDKLTDIIWTINSIQTIKRQ